MKAHFEAIPGCHIVPAHLVHCTRCGAEYLSNRKIYGRRLEGPGPHYWMWYCAMNDCYGNGTAIVPVTITEESH
jgi:hypothetical protein